MRSPGGVGSTGVLSASTSTAIRVSVEDGGRVSMDGYVHDGRVREAAEHAGWLAPGVVRVDDRLRIS